uniref:Cerebellin 11 n=1 Tax=Electrophorus electricus TaxID=8005 RepID=A0AAY5EKR6_ELEEL
MLFQKTHSQAFYCKECILCVTKTRTWVKVFTCEILDFFVPKVAFTASMTSEEDLHRGPFTSEKKLIFDKVLTNIGDAYNPKTGVFIAPVKGIYYFRYSGYAFTLHNMGLSIFKGNTRFVSSYEHTSGEKNDNVSNGAVMQLSAGEEVHMRLWIQSWIFVDYRYNYSTFTGYLLYPI